MLSFKNVILGWIIAFIIGGICTGAVGYYISYRPTVDRFQYRVEQYREQQRNYEEVIGGLQSENKRLIDGIRSGKEDLLRQTGEIIKGTFDSITKLKKVAQLLQNYYNN